VRARRPTSDSGCARGTHAILYVLWTSCQWKALPKDLPPRSTVWDFLDRWAWDATLDADVSSTLRRGAAEGRSVEAGRRLTDNASVPTETRMEPRWGWVAISLPGPRLDTRAFRPKAGDTAARMADRGVIYDSAGDATSTKDTLAESRNHIMTHRSGSKANPF
jgi:hypothetical protein